MSARELFLAALELHDPQARAQYLDRGCEGDASLRARVEALLKSHEEAGSFLEEPAAHDEGATAAQALPIDSNDATTPDASAASPGPTSERTQADHDATGAFQPRPAVEATKVPRNAAGNGPHGAAAATAEGNGVSGQPTRGTTVRYFGDYEIQKELGRGGMGVVYKARQVTLNRPVALKMIKAGVLADEDELRRFQNEAEAVALLDHGGIVPVYEVGEHDGQRYLSMKLVEGDNLAEQLASFKVNPRAVATLLAEIAEAIHHAHMRGILHRDLKPANILIDTEGHPHVTDFGLAKRVEGDVELTRSGAILGTPAYMSPEQANGRRGSITTATDIYGLGAILYALLAGKAPFGGDSVMETLDAVRTRPPESPRKFNPKTPRDLETICLKCLEKDPRRRYASAHELAVDLRNWLDSQPISARRVGTTERAWLWCKRRPAVAGLAAAVALAVVGGTAGIFAVQARANIELNSTNLALDRQKSRAEEREKQAIDAVKRFGDAVSTNAELKKNPSLEPLRKTLLKEPLAFFKEMRDRLQADRDTRPESLARLAQASFNLARLNDEIGDKLDARRAYEESIAVYERLVRENPSASEFQTTLARTQINLGILLHQTGRPAEGLASCERAHAVLERLVRENPSVTKYQGDLANNLLNVGIMLRKTGRPEEALASYKQARTVLERLARENPSVTQLQRDLALVHNNVGNAQNEMGQRIEALASLDQGRAIFERLAGKNPSVAEFRRALAASHHNIGVEYSQLGRPDEALASYEKALDIRERLASENPTVIQFQSDLALSYDTIGFVRSQSGRRLAALASYEKARDVFERLARENPSVAEFRSNLADFHSSIGFELSELGRPEEALASYQQARVLLERLVRDNPSMTEFQSSLAMSLHGIGIAEQAAGRPTATLEALEQARAIQEGLVRGHPESHIFASELGKTLSNLAAMDLDQRRFEKALATVKRAIDLQRKALAMYPDHPIYRKCLADHLKNLIRADEGLGLGAEAAEARRELDRLAADPQSEAALDARLAAVLEGQPVKDEAERSRLALRAYSRSLYAASARLFAELIANDPGRGDDRQTQPRYNAACCAALASAGKGRDDPPPDAATKAKLRLQALNWLQEELAAWAKLVASSPPQAKASIAQTLKHWQEDTDLAGIRDEKELAKLPEAERKDWQALWTDVDSLLKRVPTGKP